MGVDGLTAERSDLPAPESGRRGRPSGTGYGARQLRRAERPLVADLYSAPTGGPAARGPLPPRRKGPRGPG